MSYRVRIRPEAERDVRKAVSWYEEQRSGLGKELVLELDSVYERLAENPHLYANIHRGIRRAIVRRFPYGVFYLESAREVRVIAVVDMARNPSIWQGRVDV
jgi:plasmid stabilization system protein ParE